MSINKEDVVFIYNGLLLSHKGGWNNATCSNTDGPRDYHPKWNKSERERQIPYDITYMWNLKYDTNELIYEKETDSQTQRTDLWLPEGQLFHWTDLFSGLRAWFSEMQPTTNSKSRLWAFLDKFKRWGTKSRKLCHLQICLFDVGVILSQQSGFR